MQVGSAGLRDAPDRLHRAADKPKLRPVEGCKRKAQVAAVRGGVRKQARACAGYSPKKEGVDNASERSDASRRSPTRT